MNYLKKIMNVNLISYQGFKYQYLDSKFGRKTLVIN